MAAEGRASLAEEPRRCRSRDRTSGSSADTRSGLPDTSGRPSAVRRPRCPSSRSIWPPAESTRTCCRFGSARLSRRRDVPQSVDGPVGSQVRTCRPTAAVERPGHRHRPSGLDLARTVVGVDVTQQRPPIGAQDREDCPTGAGADFPLEVDQRPPTYWRLSVVHGSTTNLAPPCECRIRRFQGV